VEQIMTIPQVAEYLQISKSKLYLMVRREELPHIRIGKNVRVLESDLEEWLMEQRKPAEQLEFRFPEGG
jgi:excisionase family DNA binding protein